MRANNPTSIYRMRRWSRISDISMRMINCMWVARNDKICYIYILQKTKYAPLNTYYSKYILNFFFFPLLPRSRYYSGATTDATKLSAWNLRFNVWVLAAQRIESTEFPWDSSISTAKKFGLQAQQHNALLNWWCTKNNQRFIELWTVNFLK